MLRKVEKETTTLSALHDMKKIIATRLPQMESLIYRQNEILKVRQHELNHPLMSTFKLHFPEEIILLCIRYVPGLQCTACNRFQLVEYCDCPVRMSARQAAEAIGFSKLVRELTKPVRKS
jgi:hypothetical protein